MKVIYFDVSNARIHSPNGHICNFRSKFIVTIVKTRVFCTEASGILYTKIMAKCQIRKSLNLSCC